MKSPSLESPHRRWSGPARWVPWRSAGSPAPSPGSPSSPRASTTPMQREHHGQSSRGRGRPAPSHTTGYSSRADTARTRRCYIRPRSLPLRSASAPGGSRATRVVVVQWLRPGRGRRGLCGAAPQRQARCASRSVRPQRDAGRHPPDRPHRLGPRGGGDPGRPPDRHRRGGRHDPDLGPGQRRSGGRHGVGRRCPVGAAG
jgi:hypothetical protein